MYAIVEIAGKQFLTEVGKELKIPHQKDVEINKKISFDKVLIFKLSIRINCFILNKALL